MTNLEEAAREVEARKDDFGKKKNGRTEKKIGWNERQLNVSACQVDHIVTATKAEYLPCTAVSPERFGLGSEGIQGQLGEAFVTRLIY